IVTPKNASSNHGYSHGFEIIRRHTMRFCAWFFTRSWLGLTEDRKILLMTKPTKGHIFVDCGGRYPRKRLNLFKQLFIERHLPSCVMVLQRREFEANSQKMIWVKPEWFVL